MRRNSCTIRETGNLKQVAIEWADGSVGLFPTTRRISLGIVTEFIAGLPCCFGRLRPSVRQHGSSYLPWPHEPGPHPHSSPNKLARTNGSVDAT